MVQVSGYINIRNNKLHYLKGGFGKKVLLTFHGYGSNATQLLPVAGHIGKAFTVYNFDLPHHGNSSWPDDECMIVEDLKVLINSIKGIDAVTKVSLMGYSIGGRVCLKMAEVAPESVDKMVLIASDGLAFNSFYYFVTRTMPGRFLFRSVLENPVKYKAVAEWARSYNLIDTSRYKFAMQYLRTKQERDLLLKVWPCMSLLTPDRKKLQKLVSENDIQIHLFMGVYDKIIPFAFGERFIKEVNNTKLHKVNKGHRVFDEEIIPQIAHCLLS